MKLEIDIPSIIYNDAKENGNYISVTKLEIAWKAIADGKPLEQEPTAKNNLGVDLISRAEVLKLMQDNWHTHNGDWAMQESMDDIRALPPATPQEPRKGHWIEHPHEAGPNWKYSMYECSECHGWAEDVSDYCPDCGVRMFEPQESEG